MESKNDSKEDDCRAKECAANLERHLVKKSSNFLCCVDGSTYGDYALQTAFGLGKKHDHVTVFHSFKEHVDESKVFPVDHRKKEMQMKYECELIGHLSSSRYSTWWTTRALGVTRTAMQDLQQELMTRKHETDFPDFIVMGHIGRKGRKDSHTLLGSNSDASLRGLYLPVIIAKTPCAPSPRVFMMAVDGSDSSDRGLDVLLHLIGARDKLVLIHFYCPATENDYAKAQLLQSKYEEELLSYGPLDSSFQLIEKEQGKALTHCIVDHVNDSVPDVDFFGICPRDKARLSSLSEYVVNHVNCSVVFCKS